MTQNTIKSSKSSIKYDKYDKISISSIRLKRINITMAKRTGSSIERLSKRKVVAHMGIAQVHG